MATQGSGTARARRRREGRAPARAKWRVGFALVLFALPSLGEEPIAVAVTLAPQAWLVEQIGGGNVALTTLVGPGESPATYLPADRQVSDLMRSAVYFSIGVPCEQGTWFDAVRRSGRVELVDLRQGLELHSLPRGGHEHAGHRVVSAAPAFEDPHVWLSPGRLRLMATTIAETLARLDGAGADLYRRRLALFEERLDLLDSEIRNKLTPLAGRAFMVFHPSWGYLASDYGLRQLAIEIEGKQPSDAELTQLVMLARREAVSVIFVQPQISSRSAEVVARAIGGRTQVLDPLAADVVANLSRVVDRIAVAMETR